jgi:Uma2 family endonuclease
MGVATTLTQRLASDAGASPVPAPLENGDQLSAAEFLRRYEAMPLVKKAELIEGIVYMPSPVRLEQHAEPDTLVQLWLASYAARTPGTRAAANATLRLDADNVPQPDALLRILPECGGKARPDAAGYLNGPPELIVEIAASSATIDLRDKLRVYRRAGVQEYIVWRTLDAELDWFVLERDEYRRLTADAERRLASQSFPGLTLSVPALLARDSAKVLDVLQVAMQSQSHADFIARLNASRQS